MIVYIFRAILTIRLIRKKNCKTLSTKIILKNGKDHHKVSSYKSISLLPISKILVL